MCVCMHLYCRLALVCVFHLVMRPALLLPLCLIVVVLCLVALFCGCCFVLFWFHIPGPAVASIRQRSSLALPLLLAGGPLVGWVNWRQCGFQMLLSAWYFFMCRPNELCFVSLHIVLCGVYVLFLFLFLCLL